jgi:hypothetical protein
MCLAAEDVPIDAHCSTPAPFFLVSQLADLDDLDDLYRFSITPVLPGFLLFYLLMITLINLRPVTAGLSQAMDGMANIKRQIVNCSPPATVLICSNPQSLSR